MRNLIVLLAFSALLTAVHADAKPPENRGKPADAHSNQASSDDLARITIEIEAARRLAVDHRLVGQQALPPGIRKNLARGKPLPPGIAKRSLPTPYLRQLPVYPGYEWQMAGSDLVLLEAASGVIADVLIDVFN